MSKYTTEVRFICESKSGLEESKGASSVDEVLAKSWDKIFTSKVSFFDEAYRSVLCQKILKHYYLREIGAETVGIWMLWMNTKLEEIMSYYNQLYESAKIKFNPMQDVDLSRTHNRTVEGTTTDDETRTNTTSDTRTVKSDGTTKVTNNSTAERVVNNTGTKKDLYSDTPQGAITGLENENYLTNARKVTNVDDETESNTVANTQNGESTQNETDTATGTNNGTTKSSGSNNSTEEYVETISGKQGTESYSKMLQEFRKTLLNIDMQVIEEFDELFFGLW